MVTLSLHTHHDHTHTKNPQLPPTRARLSYLTCKGISSQTVAAESQPQGVCLLSLFVLTSQVTNQKETRDLNCENRQKGASRNPYHNISFLFWGLGRSDWSRRGSEQQLRLAHFYQYLALITQYLLGALSTRLQGFKETTGETNERRSEISRRGSLPISHHFFALQFQVSKFLRVFDSLESCPFLSSFRSQYRQKSRRNLKFKARKTLRNQSGVSQIHQCRFFLPHTTGPNLSLPFPSRVLTPQVSQRLNSSHAFSTGA